MPVLVLIVVGLATFSACFVAIATIGPFRRTSAVISARATSAVVAVLGQQAVFRGRIVGARRASPYPRLTSGSVVYSRLQVYERVGKDQRLALDARAAQLFILDDGSGVKIDVDPRTAQVDNLPQTSASGSALTPALRAYIEHNGSFQWPNTPRSCVEDYLLDNTVVTIHGQVFKPHPGELQPGDSELRISARAIAIHAASPWQTRPGRTLIAASLGFIVGLVACLGCVAWAGWLS